MQDFITIPTHLINEFPPDKFYALADILSMADENGEIRVSTPALMTRWKWGNTKVRNFIDSLVEKGVFIQETNNPTNKETNKRQTIRQTRVLLVNTRFLTLSQTKAQTRNKQADKQGNKQERNFRVSVSKEEAYQRIADAWNELLPYGIEPISVGEISRMQQQKIADIAKEYGVEDILKTIQRIQNSDFLQGKSKCGWKITFDWFVLPGNFIKVIAGNYDNRNGGIGNAPTRAIKTYDDRIGKNGT